VAIDLDKLGLCESVEEKEARMATDALSPEEED